MPNKPSSATVAVAAYCLPVVDFAAVIPGTPVATTRYPKNPMETRRLIALFIFFFSGFLLWQAWEKQHKPVVPPAAPSTQSSAALPSASPQSASTAPASPPTTGTATTPPQVGEVRRGERIKVRTDVVSAEIDSQGGDLRRLELLKHFAAADRSRNLMLMQDEGALLYLAQSGVIAPGRDDVPNHLTTFQPEARDYRLENGKESLDVVLSARTADGIEVVKTYTFHRASYLVDVKFDIRNGSANAISPEAYFQFQRNNTPPEGDPKFVSTYTGPAVYTGKKFQKVSFDDIAKGKLNYPPQAHDGWIAMLQHYFVAAWLPKDGVAREYYTRKLSEQVFMAGTKVAIGAIAPGANATITVPLYAGPQEGEKLAKLAPGLDLTIDFGWLTIIAYPLFWVLWQIHKLVGNWGVAIILLTVILKLLFFPLSAASYKAMARMKVLAPKMQQLKERYGDNREKMNQAMMELYKTEKVNPLGGCLPIVIQIPVFIALYWVLLAAVELRHAPFFGWIQDLASPDPFYILPIIMGATMILQTKLNPTPPDPVQAKIMTIMPIAFSVFFFFFPAGLVLYWTINNILSIAQQWQINRMMEASAAKGYGKR